VGLRPRGLRLPGAVELPWARRRRLRAERGTVALGLAAFGMTGAVLGSELARVLRERIHEHPELDVIDSADVAVR
jgi:Na+/glutamate symporter